MLITVILVITFTPPIILCIWKIQYIKVPDPLCEGLFFSPKCVDTDVFIIQILLTTVVSGSLASIVGFFFEYPLYGAEAYLIVASLVVPPLIGVGMVAKAIHERKKEKFIDALSGK